VVFEGSITFDGHPATIPSVGRKQVLISLKSRSRLPSGGQDAFPTTDKGWLNWQEYRHSIIAQPRCAIMPKAHTLQERSAPDLWTYPYRSRSKSSYASDESGPIFATAISSTFPTDLYRWTMYTGWKDVSRNMISGIAKGKRRSRDGNEVGMLETNYPSKKVCDEKCPLHGCVFIDFPNSALGSSRTTVR
jgi:hypothetical protein